MGKRREREEERHNHSQRLQRLVNMGSNGWREEISYIQVTHFIRNPAPMENKNCTVKVPCVQFSGCWTGGVAPRATLMTLSATSGLR